MFHLFFQKIYDLNIFTFKIYNFTNVKNRSIVTKLEIIQDELVANHAVEVINNKLTGICFHAYLKDKSQYIIFLTP